MVPADAEEAIEVWLRSHDRVAPGLIEGLYLVGSLALDDWAPRSDIDIVAFTADPATDDDAALLRSAHEQAADELAAAGWTRPVDGPRLAWGDVSVPPTPLHRPWSLDGAFHHDAECFEINPITWYTLAAHGVAVRGPAPSELGVATDLDERREFVIENVDTYWRSVGEMVTTALDDAGRHRFDAAVTEWCVLGIARMFVTFRTGDVVSKSAAGEYLAAEAPEYTDLVRHALAIRGADDEPEPDDRTTVAAVAELLDRVVATIAG